MITKNPGTGGAVTRDTVTAQLLYEIGEPAYLNPDVITHLDTATLTDLGDDRVEIRGVRGSAPPATTKVAITGVGGWENSVILALTGTDLDAKAALVERSVHRYVDAVDGLDAVAIDRIGQAQHDPDSQNAGTELLRIAVQGDEGGRRARVLVADGRAGPVQLPRVVLPRPATTRVGVRCLLARTARPSNARAHGPPPRRHHRDHRTAATHRALGGAVTPQAEPPLAQASTMDRRTGRRLTR